MAKVSVSFTGVFTTLGEILGGVLLILVKGILTIRDLGGDFFFLSGDFFFLGGGEGSGKARGD